MRGGRWWCFSEERILRFRRLLHAGWVRGLFGVEIYMGCVHGWLFVRYHRNGAMFSFFFVRAGSLCSCCQVFPFQGSNLFEEILLAIVCLARDLIFRNLHQQEDPILCMLSPTILRGFQARSWI